MGKSTEKSPPKQMRRSGVCKCNSLDDVTGMVWGKGGKKREKKRTVSFLTP